MERCLSNVINSIHMSCEIICVSDGTMDDSLKIVKKYQKVYKSIRLIELNKNEGLFKARLTGIKAARGDYIGFMDSDDMISDYYYDHLYQAIIDKNADISVGRVVNQTTDGKRYIQTRCKRFPYLLTDVEDTEDSIESLFWRQEGKCYHFHVVWNKLYRSSVLREALPWLDPLQEHQVMMEDFIFSAVWFGRIRTYSVVEEADYYYLESPSSSIRSRTVESIINNLQDIDRAFSFVRGFLEKTNKLSLYQSHLAEWEKLYGRIWKRNILEAELDESERQKCLQQMKKIFGDEIGMYSPEDDFYYRDAYVIGEN